MSREDFVKRLGELQVQLANAKQGMEQAILLFHTVDGAVQEVQSWIEECDKRAAVEQTKGENSE